MKQKCQRCGANFECRSNDIENCDCNSIVLTDMTFKFLSKTNYECICNLCLREVDEIVNRLESISDETKEGIHYYMEGGLLVFSEIYHMKRGYCCENNCRHCPYGFKLKNK